MDSPKQFESQTDQSQISFATSSSTSPVSTTPAAQKDDSCSTSPLSPAVAAERQVEHPEQLPSRPIKTPRQRRRHLQARQRKQQTISIINATYGVCVGNNLSPKTRSLAYPVFPSGDDRFLIPATRAEYFTLCSYKLRSDARRTFLEFHKSITVPGRPIPTSCIVVTMAKLGHEVAKEIGPIIYGKLITAKFEDNGTPLKVVPTGEAERTLVYKDDSRFNRRPDTSYSLSGAEYPFLILEVKDAQSLADFRSKIRAWVKWTKAKVKIVCAFEFQKIRGAPDEQYRILASVIKCVKHFDPSPTRPGRFVIRKNWVVRGEDISSQPSQASFTINKAEMMSMDEPRDGTTDTDCVTIDLASFYGQAAQAVYEKLEQKKREAQDKEPDRYEYDSDQSDESDSTISSIPEEESDNESGDEVDPPDGEYKD